ARTLFVAEETNAATPVSVPSTEPQPEAVSAAVAPDLLGALTQPRSLDLNVPQTIVAAYGVVVVGFAIWWLVGIAQLVRLCRTATPAPASAVEAFREIAGPDADRVRLLASRRIELPLTFTGLAPVILLPEVVCRDGGAALRFCLAHEWSHVERRDA